MLDIGKIPFGKLKRNTCYCRRSIFKIYTLLLLYIDRQYYRKWAVLTDPKDLTAGPKGYVKCNITVNVKDEKVKVHPETVDEDDIEG